MDGATAHGWPLYTRKVDKTAGNADIMAEGHTRKAKYAKYGKSTSTTFYLYRSPNKQKWVVCDELAKVAVMKGVMCSATPATYENPSPAGLTYQVGWKRNQRLNRTERPPPSPPHPARPRLPYGDM